MNVLLVSVKSEISKGGIAVWTDCYLNGCKKNNIDCSLVNTATIGKGAVQGTSGRNLKDELARTLKIRKELKKKLSEKMFDVAHFNTNIGLFGIIRDYYLLSLIHKKKIPIVLHFHCDIPYWVNNRIIKHYLKESLKLTKVNFVLCENSKRYLDENFNAASIKIPNFVDDSLLIESRDVKKKVEKIFFVGRITRMKGAKEIFALAEMFPDITFELVGEVSGEVATWSKPTNIVFAGIMSHDEVISHMDDADVFLFPSHTEGFSLALAEAMARGLHVIATDVGANRDMIEDKGGVIADIGDTVAMEAALVRFFDADVRKTMSEWNVEKAKSNY